MRAEAGSAVSSFSSARVAARFAAWVTLMRSITRGVTAATAWWMRGSALIAVAHVLRCEAESFFESRSTRPRVSGFVQDPDPSADGRGRSGICLAMEAGRSPRGTATAHTTTGPASGPRPTSSMPMIYEIGLRLLITNSIRNCMAHNNGRAIRRSLLLDNEVWICHPECSETEPRDL